MADITDRPHSAPAYAPGPGEDGLPYRPLSGLAVAGFVLAAFYAFLVVGVFAVANLGSLPVWLRLWAVGVPVVGVVACAAAWPRSRQAAVLLAAAYAVVLGGGLVYYAGGATWLMPAWTALVPLAALAVCGAAARRVRAAEGTLAGGELARWGIGLTLAVGLTYWSYWAATYLAVRQQAAAFVQGQWLKALAGGDADTGYLLTLEPGRRPANDVRKTLEVSNISPDPSTPGPLSRFGQQTYVRLLQVGGPETAFSLVSSGMPTFEKGGLQVQLVYHARSRFAEFDLAVTANGTDAKGKGQAGRQWYVVVEKTNLIGDTPQATEEGRALSRETNVAGNWAREWGRLVSSATRTPADLESAYQLTLPPDQRKAPDSKADDDAARRYRAGLKAFGEGSLVRADKEAFWAVDDKTRDEAAAETRKMFDPAFKGDWIQFPNAGLLPTLSRDDRHVRLGFDVQMLVKDKIVGGRVVAVADTPELGPAPASWRVESLELVRVRTMPPGGPGGPAARRMPGM